LVWAHGLDATVSYFDPLLHDIAAHGYVVAAPTFPLTHAGLATGSDFNDYVNQPADVSFVITQILNLFGPHGTRASGIVDPRLIAVGGHSLGAVTTLGLSTNTCCRDPRLRAAIEIDGSWLTFPHGSTVEHGVPVLFIHGDADRAFSMHESVALFASSLAPKYLVILHGMPHTPFRIPAAFAVIENTIVDFLDAYLRGTPGAVSRLIATASVPGLATMSSLR
jgi:predicted dienelactone hydrolase